MLQSGMTNEAVRLPALSAFAAAVFVIALLAVAGCSTGHAGTDPINIPQNPVTTRASYTNPTAPTIAVSFPTPDAVVTPTFLLEYHIYRNDVLVARVTLAEAKAVSLPGATTQTSRFTYTDNGETAPIDYKTVGALPVQIVDARSPGVGAFSASTPLIYRITGVYGGPDLEGQTTYSEQETGCSDVVTPFRSDYQGSRE